MLVKLIVRAVLTLTSLAVFAAPALPETLTFTMAYGGASKATISGGAGSSLTAFSGSVTGIQYNGNAALTVADTLSFTVLGNGNDQFTLNGYYGSVGSSGSPVELLQFTTTAATVTSGSGGNDLFTVLYGAATSLNYFNPSLATALSISVPNAVTVTAGSDFDLGSAVTTSQNITSDTLATALSNTPEPASSALLGAGLLAIGLMGKSRRRAARS